MTRLCVCVGGVGEEEEEGFLTRLHLKLNPASLRDSDKDLLSVLTFSPMPAWEQVWEQQTAAERVRSGAGEWG